MKIIMVIVLLSLCFNGFSEGQMEQGVFEVVYTETIKLAFDSSCEIYIIRCTITKDLFLVFQKHGYLEQSIAIIKLDSRYSEFIKGK